MVPTQPLLLLSPLIIFSLIRTCGSLGLRDYNEDCDPAQSYSPDETLRCDSDRGLFCKPKTSECSCIDTTLYYQRGRCRAKVNRFCGTIEGFKIECVKYAECNMTMNTCNCLEGYRSNQENTACSTDSGVGTNRIDIFSSGLGILILLFLQLVM